MSRNGKAGIWAPAAFSVTRDPTFWANVANGLTRFAGGVFASSGVVAVWEGAVDGLVLAGLETPVRVEVIATVVVVGVVGVVCSEIVLVVEVTVGGVAGAVVATVVAFGVVVFVVAEVVQVVVVVASSVDWEGVWNGVVRGVRSMDHCPLLSMLSSNA